MIQSGGRPKGERVCPEENTREDSMLLSHFAMTVCNCPSHRTGDLLSLLAAGGQEELGPTLI